MKKLLLALAILSAAGCGTAHNIECERMAEDHVNVEAKMATTDVNDTYTYNKLVQEANDIRVRMVDYGCDVSDV